MAADVPLERLKLGARSFADEATFVALADLAEIVESTPGAEYRLIGGVMVSLHVARWQLGPRLYRQTNDADLGVPPAVIIGTDVIAKLERRDYRKVAGNRFERRLEPTTSARGDEAPKLAATIDVLVPAYTSRARDDVVVGDLHTTEVRGLAFALQRPPARVALQMVLLDGRTTLGAHVQLPDEQSVLVLRAYAWALRGQGTDAVDLWRALEIASVAGVVLKGPSVNIERAADAIRQAFVEPGAAFEPLARTLGLSREGETDLRTRIRALVARVLDPG